MHIFDNIMSMLLNLCHVLVTNFIFRSRSSFIACDYSINDIVSGA